MSDVATRASGTRILGRRGLEGAWVCAEGGGRGEEWGLEDAAWRGDGRGRSRMCSMRCLGPRHVGVSFCRQLPGLVLRDCWIPTQRKALVDAALLFSIPMRTMHASTSMGARLYGASRGPIEHQSVLRESARSRNRTQRQCVHRSIVVKHQWSQPKTFRIRCHTRNSLKW